MGRESYLGGKGNSYQKLINLMPPHGTYVETHLGAGSVMAAKRAAHFNIGIEINADVLKETAQRIQPGGLVITDEDYRHLSPGMAMRAPLITSGDVPCFTFVMGDALEFLNSYTFAGDELVYNDPPYLEATRKSRHRYDFEYTDQQHEQLLHRLKSLNCMVMISGYWSEMYADHLAGWTVYSFEAMTRGGTWATEYLWMNYPAPTKLHDYQYLGEDFRERERIKKKKTRWVRKLEGMSQYERQAIMWAIEEAGLS